MYNVLDSIQWFQGHPEEVYAAEFLQGGPESRLLTASAWKPYVWDLETCQQLAEGGPIAAPAADQAGASMILSTT